MNELLKSDDENVELSHEELTTRFRNMFGIMSKNNFRFDKSGVEQIFEMMKKFGEINNLPELEKGVGEIRAAIKMVAGMKAADEAQKKVYRFAHEDGAIK